MTGHEGKWYDHPVFLLGVAAVGFVWAVYSKSRRTPDIIPPRPDAPMIYVFICKMHGQYLGYEQARCPGCARVLEEMEAQF